MAYRDDVAALSPDHLYRFDGDVNDSVGTLNGTNTSFTLTGAAICEDATNSAFSNAVGDRVALATSTDVDGALDRKAVCGWFQASAIQLPPKSIYREGTVNNQYNIIMWAGNKLMFEVNNAGTVLQAFADNVFSPGRDYHIFTRCEGTGFGNKVELYVDGVKQAVTEPDPAPLGTATLPARAAAEFADPSGTTEVGNASVLLNAPVNGLYAFWATFSGANAQLTDTEIREELFEKGALADATISAGTQAAMQTSLDALADTARPDAPLCIRVEAVTGDGDVTLTADNITFDALASIHVQYMGSGTLTWINTNGANASIGSTPGGGAINFVTPATLTVSPLIANSEVRIYEAGTTTEIAGIEVSGTSFAQSINVASVDVVVHKEDYEYIRVESVDMTGGDVSLPVSQRFDRNYENP